jgi:hypothetical protein
MSDRITQDSDPVLWGALYSSYLREGRPGHVTRGTSLYRAYIAITEELVFEKADNEFYLDSRSLINSKKANYKNLDG